MRNSATPFFITDWFGQGPRTVEVELIAHSPAGIIVRLTAGDQSLWLCKNKTVTPSPWSLTRLNFLVKTPGREAAIILYELKCRLDGLLNGPDN